MTAVYDDNPIGDCAEDLDPGQCNEDGLEFRLDDPPLLLAEADYSYNKNGARPGIIKLGGWYDFGKFDDQRRREPWAASDHWPRSWYDGTMASINHRPDGLWLPATVMPGVSFVRVIGSGGSQSGRCPGHGVVFWE
jgi:hypothetical protein